MQIQHNTHTRLVMMRLVLRNLLAYFDSDLRCTIWAEPAEKCCSRKMEPAAKVIAEPGTVL